MLLLACAFGRAGRLGAAGAGLLDGQRFAGLNGNKGQPLDPDEHEQFSFDAGLFHSASCDPYGFGSSPYRARAVGDAIHFEAVTTSPSHGRIEWQGVVRGDVAEATFVWTKERWYWNTRREYWFQGRRVK